ncbi:hypothetical protein GCM10010359_57210 [Streptomyces morookaense]|nr:hypothetical protein GCM10010359_57210 [Streptomyces morookaense]
MDGDGEHGAEGGRGDDADAQAGVRAGADADDDVRHVRQLPAGLREDPVDGGKQQLTVPAGVHLTRLGDDGVAVVEGYGDGGGGGIKSEQQHTDKRTAPGGASGARPGTGR